MKRYDVAKALKELREGRGLSQQDIAKVLGVTRTGYGKYENSHRVISFDFLVVLADYYDISLDEFANREDRIRHE